MILAFFDVTRSSPNFRFADAPVAIRLTEQTRFIELTEPMFPYTDADLQVLMAFANTNRELPDIVGEVKGFHAIFYN
ncbi:hypothetical protein Bca4012_020601 [Brassica carinata]